MQKIKADNKYREKELINGLEISDGINPNKKLLLSSDEDHIEMSTGRTWREEYMSLLKQHGKEVTSTGGAITVNNGIKGRVISGEIKGNTKVYKRLKGTQDVWVEIPSTETRDTVTYEYKLDSTQCILNNNGSLYPVYEPTIKGTATGLAPTIVFSPVLPTLMTGDVLDLATKTITFANATTKVLTDEQMKAYSVYKKVILLGGLAGVKDTLEILEDGSGIWNRVSAHYFLKGTDDWTLTNTGTPNYYFQTRVSNMLTPNKIMSDKFTSGVIGNTTTNTGIDSIASGHIRIRPSTTEPTLEAFKASIADGINVTCLLDKPVVTHIPKELVPTILTHNQTNILEVGGVVKTSSFKVTVPTTDGIKKEYTLTPINGWTGTAKANLLQTGDTELVLDLTIPESFNTLITNLPNELKPKTERTVLGYNGNTPVVVKIGTDGTVKLPVTTTGVVKLDDTYKL